MPILFKQHQRLQSSQRFTPDRPQPRRLLNAPGTAIRRLSIRLSEGRGRLQAGSRVRAGLRRHSIRAGRSARRSISRLRRHGSSIRKYFRDPKLLCQLVKYIYKRRHLNHLIPLIFVMLYMLIGAFLFNWLETAAEKDRILAKNVDYERERSLFVKRMEEIVVDLAARDPGRRREHVAEAVDHLSWKLSHELASKEEEWSLSTSMYFAGTIFTTIGYGDVACATFTGRMATVLYAIFGIPLMLCTWNEMGKFLYKTINEFMAALTGWCERSSCFTKLRQKIVAKCCCLCKKEQKGEEEDDVEKGNAVMNGKLPSSHHRRHHKREHSKAVNFKLSMQMPAVTAVEDNAQFREALEEKLEEAKRRSRRRMEKKGEEVQSDDDDDNDEEEEESEEDEEVESAAAEHSQESETIYDNLMAETKAGDKGKEEEEKESEEEEGSASGGSSSSSSASSSSDDESSEEEEEQAGDGFYGDFDGLLEEPKEEEAPRMHVLVAIGSTFAWVFFCAALFQFWEEWSYWESLYFMFISLLTVGLGDINVRRRDLMVVCFIFVIIGLSLVSMCIMVIQSSLEDLYRRLLMKMVTDYQVKLSRDARRNSGAVPWKAFGRESKAAKYLLPILSDNTKRSLMQQVKEDARDSGMQIPVAFDDFTSLNEIIEKDMSEDEGEEEQESKEPEWLPPVANGILKRTHQEPPPIAKSASFSGFLLDIHTQTDCLRSFDAFGQTEETKFNDLHAQTEQSATADWLRKKAAVGVHTGQQTEGPPRVNKKIQSAILRLRDGQTMTEGLCGSRQIQKNAEAQTEEHLRADAQCQTRAPVDLREMAEKEAQTYKFMKSRRIQTPVPLLYDQQTQTIDTDLRGRLYPSVSMLRLFLSPIETMQN